MREICTSGSEGGGALTGSPYLYSRRDAGAPNQQLRIRFGELLPRPLPPHPPGDGREVAAGQRVVVLLRRAGRGGETLQRLGEAAEVDPGHADVIGVVEALQRAGLEAGQELVVGHGFLDSTSLCESLAVRSRP